MKLGAQNMHWEDKGAFTGEVAPGMVAEFCKYVIIGHSERRTYFGETDESVNKKVRAAQAADLTPIVCVGEKAEEGVGLGALFGFAERFRDGEEGVEDGSYQESSAGMRLRNRLDVLEEPSHERSVWRSPRSVPAVMIIEDHL